MSSFREIRSALAQKHYIAPVVDSKIIPIIGVSRLLAKRSLVGHCVLLAATELDNLDKKLHDKEAELAEATHRIREVPRRAADAVDEQSRTILSEPEHYRSFRQNQ